MSPFEEDDGDDYWPDEPTEFDPDSIGPKVDVPEAPSFDDGVDDDLFQAFWVTVLLANFGLFAVSLGAMLVVFRGQLQLGGFVFVLGALGLLFGYRRYRNYVNDRDDEDDAEADDEDNGDDGDGAGVGDPGAVRAPGARTDGTGGTDDND